MAHTTFTVEIDRDMFDGMVDTLSQDQTLLLRINNELARIFDPWVPFLEGPLSQNLTITSQGITYNQPYATRQYYGVDFNHTKDYHPLASAKWDEAAIAVKHDEFEKILEGLINERLGELYGK